MKLLYRFHFDICACYYKNLISFSQKKKSVIMTGKPRVTLFFVILRQQIDSSDAWKGEIFSCGFCDLLELLCTGFTSLWQSELAQSCFHLHLQRSQDLSLSLDLLIQPSQMWNMLPEAGGRGWKLVQQECAQISASAVERNGVMLVFVSLIQLLQVHV